MLFVIVGSGRCGTGLLGRMLNAHTDLFVLNESHWLPKMFEFFGTGSGSTQVLADIVRRTWHITDLRVYPGTVAEIDEATGGSTNQMTVAEFGDLIVGALAAKEGKRFWADKTPDYGPYMATLQLLWPELRFVHLIRHGGAVAQSMARHPGFRWLAAAGETWWVPASFNRYYRAVATQDAEMSEYAVLWERRTRRIRDEATRLRPGTYREFRFESLIERPAETLTEIARFVGLASPPDWLRLAPSLLDRARPSELRAGWAPPPMPPGPAELMDELHYEVALRQG